MFLHSGSFVNLTPFSSLSLPCMMTGHPITQEISLEQFSTGGEMEWRHCGCADKDESICELSG